MVRSVGYVLLTLCLTSFVWSNGSLNAEHVAGLSTWKGEKYEVSDSTVFILHKGLSCRECYTKIFQDCSKKLPTYEVVFVCAQSNSVLSRKQRNQSILSLIKSDSIPVLFAQMEENTILGRQYDSPNIVFPEVIVQENSNVRVYDYKALKSVDFKISTLLAKVD